ncbi:MAG: hypothetical protein ACR2OE_13385 [Thermomicrobiales bacterium]
MTERDQILVDLGPMSTSRERCLMLRTGTIDADTISQAEAARYDQLPVLDDEGRLCGLIATERARALLDAGEDLDPVAHHLTFHTVTRSVDLFDLLSAFENHRAVIFRRDTVDDASDDDWFAIVTISDLNRHPLRSYLYPILVELESALAELIDCQFRQEEEWLASCSECARVRILEIWEVAVRHQVEISRVTGCTLIDMVNIVAKSGDLRSMLGFASRNKFEKETGSIRDVRNQIMHPVRPLILDQDDVGKLQDTLGCILRMTERAVAANAVLIEQDHMPARFLP